MDSRKKREWLWFAGLWFGGLATVAVLAYVLKLFLRFV